MAITQNALARDTVAGGTSLSFNVSVEAGDNNASLIGVSYSPLFEGTLVNVTFGGVNATFIQLVQNVGGAVEQYYAKGTPVGSRTLSVTWDGTVTGTVGVLVMNGVDQTTPLGAIGTAHIDPGTSITVTLPSTTANNWVIDTIQVPAPTPTSSTPDPSQTILWAVTPGTAPDRFFGGASQKTSGGGSVSMTWTINPSRHVPLAAAEFRAAATAPSVSLGGYTSYDYPADPAPLETYRDPAEQQRVWVRDRRYTEGRV